MLVIFLSLIVCVIAVKCLFAARPAIFIFQLIENVIGKGHSDKRDSMKVCLSMVSKENNEEEVKNVIKI